MNCDDFLPMRTTGNVWQRLQARRHARRCDRCAAAARAIDALARELTQAPSLPPHLRDAWIRAAGEPSTTVVLPWRRFRLATAGLAAAAAIVAATLFWGNARQPANLPGPVVNNDNQLDPVPIARITERTIDESAELRQLLDDVDALETQLAAAARQAELLDARRRADTLIAAYSQWR